MEVECTTPQGSPTPEGSPQTRSPIPPTSIRMNPTILTFKPSSRLTPLSEYEVSSSALGSTLSLTPTASPQLAGRHLFNAQQLSKNPSPDSAIHSAYYSPSQSPVQSRHMSGFSSPFSLRTTPSLSRNNSDASQYGGSVSAGPASTISETSPLSPTQFSPTHSPVQARHPHLQVIIKRFYRVKRPIFPCLGQVLIFLFTDVSNQRKIYI